MAKKKPKPAPVRNDPIAGSPAPERTQIRIICQEKRTNDIYDLGDGAIVPTGGFGGWEEILIPGQVNLTDYAGVETLKLDVPILLGAPDDYAQNRDQDGNLMKLLRLARNFEDGDEPSVIQIFGAAMLFSGGHFIIIGFEYDKENTERAPGGKLLRMPLVMQVSEFSNPNQVKIRKKKKRIGISRGSVAAPPNHYTVKHGENLFDIALYFYGDRDKWEPIARINGIRDPRSVKAGHVLKMP